MSHFPRETIGSQILGVNRQSGRLCITDHLWNIGGDPRPEVGRLRAAMPSAPPEVGFCRLERPSHLLLLWFKTSQKVQGRQIPGREIQITTCWQNVCSICRDWTWKCTNRRCLWKAGLLMGSFGGSQPAPCCLDV